MPDCPTDLYCVDTSSEHWQQFRHRFRRERKKIRLFHGTHPKNASNIDSKGLQASTHGRLGSGIYFAEKTIADSVARAWGSGSYVIEVEIDVGNMKILRQGEADPRGDWHRQGYDTCQAIHPPWDGVTLHSFKEWCVFDSNRVTVIASHQKDATTHFSALPRTPILAHGKNQIRIRNNEDDVTVHSDHEDNQIEVLVTKSKRLHINVRGPRKQDTESDSDSDLNEDDIPHRSTRTQIPSRNYFYRNYR